MSSKMHLPDLPPYGDPYSPSAVRPETILLDKIKLAMGGRFSPTLLDEIRIYRDQGPELNATAQHLAYRIEAMVYGREAWEQTVERKTETGKTETEAGETSYVDKGITVPDTWLDHAKQTLWVWLDKKPLFQRAWKLAQEYPDPFEEREPTWKERLANSLTLWMSRRARAVKWRLIDQKITVKRYYDVTHVTKHIEVKKHFHICPHLDIKSNGPHLQFLANASELRSL